MLDAVDRLARRQPGSVEKEEDGNCDVREDVEGIRKAASRGKNDGDRNGAEDEDNEGIESFEALKHITECRRTPTVSRETSV